MQIIQAVFLGLLQGLTEFIPVSSSGHLILAEKVLNLTTSGFVFDAVLNIGTIAALIIYFRREIWQMLSTANRKLAGLIVLGTLPGLVGGLLLQDAAASGLRSEYIVVAMLIGVGLLMLIAEKLAQHRRDIAQLNIKDSLAVGLAQVLAFIPGTSRSGITMVAGIGRGLSREAAAKFSFYLAIPILGGGVVKVLFDDGVAAEVANNLPVFIAGVLAAFGSGYLAVAFLLRYLQRHSLNIFAYYRFALAAVILLLTLVK